VKDVRLSGRLTDSPACLVADAGDMTPQMEQILKSMGQEVSPGLRILEVNARHSILQKLHQIFEGDAADSRLKEYAGLLLGQAVLAEGGELSDPAEFAKSLAGLMSRSLE
jgi:molecular chaperone HtpG